MTDSDTKRIFDKAKSNKIPKYNKPIIPCFCCGGAGEIRDMKSGVLRNCVGCGGSGVIKNTNRRYKKS